MRFIKHIHPTLNLTTIYDTHSKQIVRLFWNVGNTELLGNRLYYKSNDLLIVEDIETCNRHVVGRFQSSHYDIDNSAIFLISLYYVFIIYRFLCIIKDYFLVMNLNHSI